METIELWGECGDFAITPRLWRTILSVAQHYGWEPTGTLPPDPDYVDEQLVELCDRVFWDGRYYPGCLQRIIEWDAQALAAALYTVRPQENYFKTSAAGTISVLDDGRTQFTPTADGKHRYLIFDPDQKDRILQAYVELASTKQVPRAPRFRPPQKKQ